MRASSSPRRASRLPHPVQHQLNMYALAASAAGVSLLALSQPTEAKIVYTKTHYVIGQNGVYPLDLNHDGTIDFLIQKSGTSTRSHNFLGVMDAFGNAVEGTNSASALKSGAPIGPGQRFGNVYSAAMAGYGCSDFGCGTFGRWIDVTNGYLGLRFKIHGKTHYGWARMSVKLHRAQITATLSGYAYETVANKAIHAGQTHGAVDDATASPDLAPLGNSAAAVANPILHAIRPASLGRLAVGAGSVPLWRQP